jgi:CubicO group peptidase (beta-lactamase class C family)
MTTSHRRTFLKQLGLGVAGWSLAPSFAGWPAAEAAVNQNLPRSSPEAQGVASTGILAFLEAAAKSHHEFHSFMMVRRGHVIAEGWWAPYRPTARHMLYSVSKSFTSTAVGFAVTEGKLSVEDPVTSFFPNDLPENVSDHLAALRVKHLLSMSVGHAKDSTPIITKEDNWVKAFLALPVAHPPGTEFLYNSGGTYMCSAIVQKVSGQKVLDYLTPRLFEPLEIRGMTWETCPRGINTGGWGLSLQTEALAKFGWLYLQQGVWNGRQLLPAAWINEATTFKIQQPAAAGADLEKLKETSDWHQGYCYQFWRCRHNGFRADGAFGQLAVVLRDEQTVIAVTCETANIQGELNLIWEHILPAIKDSALSPDASSQAQLKHTLASLSLPPIKGTTTSPSADRISGKAFQIEPNDAGVESVTLTFGHNACVFSLKDSHGDHSIRCGLEKWVDGQTDMPGTPPKITVGDLRPCKTAASGTWKDPNTFEMTWRYYETPHHDSVTCRFDGNHGTIEFMSSIAQNSQARHDARPVLRGQMAS